MLESCSSSGRPLGIDVIAAIVEDVVRCNDEKYGCSSDELPPHAMTVFHGLRAPPISVKSYLERIHKYANCSPACFILAFIYLERFAQSQTDIVMSSLNVHRLLITSFMLAVKFLDDT